MTNNSVIKLLLAVGFTLFVLCTVNMALAFRYVAKYKHVAIQLAQQEKLSATTLDNYFEAGVEAGLACAEKPTTISERVFIENAKRLWIATLALRTNGAKLKYE